MKKSNSVILFILLFIIISGCKNDEIPEGCIDDSLIIDIPCTTDYTPVCGCDGVTYGNACAAINWNGVTDYTLGECED